MEKYVKDCVKSNIRILLCGIGAILLIITVFLVVCSSPEQCFPENGDWYCYALEMQISFDQAGETFLMWNEEKVICEANVDRQSARFYIECQEANSAHFTLGELVFTGDMVRLEDNYFVLQTDTEEEFTFIRIR